MQGAADVAVIDFEHRQQAAEAPAVAEVGCLAVPQILGGLLQCLSARNACTAARLAWPGE